MLIKTSERERRGAVRAAMRLAMVTPRLLAGGPKFARADNRHPLANLYVNCRIWNEKAAGSDLAPKNLVGFFIAMSCLA
jgi:hypothetical protein